MLFGQIMTTSICDIRRANALHRASNLVAVTYLWEKLGYPKLSEKRTGIELRRHVITRKYTVRKYAEVRLIRIMKDGVAV